MTALVNTARYHLTNRVNYLVLPWAILTFAFVIDVVILALTPVGNTSHRWVGGTATIYVVLFAGGLVSVSRSLPFGLTLGLSRRTYYLGTALLSVILAIVYGGVLTGLQGIERATGGWGMNMAFFRVPYLLNGPWYESWLTSLVFLALLFAYGIWYGLIFRRWGMVGLMTFTATQVAVLTAGAVVASWAHAWGSIGHFFTSLSAMGLTGVLAGLAVALLAGGFVTMRRVTV